MKINCCRCDKVIKKPATKCYCEDCVDAIAEWRVVNSIADYLFEEHTKAEARVHRMINKK